MKRAAFLAGAFLVLSVASNTALSLLAELGPVSRQEFVGAWPASVEPYPLHQAKEAIE